MTVTIKSHYTTHLNVQVKLNTSIGYITKDLWSHLLNESCFLVLRQIIVCWILRLSVEVGVIIGPDMLDKLWSPSITDNWPIASSLKLISFWDISCQVRNTHVLMHVRVTIQKHVRYTPERTTLLHLCKSEVIWNWEVMCTMFKDIDMACRNVWEIIPFLD